MEKINFFSEVCMLESTIFSNTSKFINMLRCPKAQIPSQKMESNNISFYEMEFQEFL